MKKYVPIFLILLLFVAACKKETPETIIENIKPFVELIYPMDHSYAKNGDTIFISALASDEDGTIKSVLIYKNSQLFATDSISPWENYFICTGTNQVIVSVVAIDDRDDFSDKKSASIFITEDEMPSVWISKTPYSVLENDSVVFTINSHSPNGNIVKVDFYFNDNLYGSDTLSECEFTVNSIALGTYKVYAIVEDEGGKIQKSKDIIFTVNENQPPWIEFSLYSYSSYFPGQRVSVSAHAYDDDSSIDSIFVFVNDSLFFSDDNSYPSGISYYPPKGGTYSFHAIARDDRGAIGYSDTINAIIKPGYILDEKLVDLTYSNHDDLVFGLDQINSKLLLINPITIEHEEVALPYSQAIKFFYSMNDEKLFIVYKYEGIISVWDYNSQSLSEISFSGNADAIDIEVDDINRRIYVLATNGLNIINQDNNELINTTSLNSIYDIAIDPDNRWLLGCSRGSSIYVKKYDVVNDVPELIQSNTFSGSYKNQIRINNSNNYFIIPGLGESQTSLAIDINNMDNTVGEFLYNEWYNYSSFSPDNDLLFTALNNYDDNQLVVMDAENYKFIDQIIVPNTDAALMCSNYSRNKLVIFSYDTYSDNEIALFFIDIDY